MQSSSAHKSNKLSIAALALTLAACRSADFLPIPLTPESYNQDVVVEKTASPPLVPVTTASMDGGLANTNFTWYERGYRPEWPTTGLPKAGTRRDSEAAADHEYQFAPSYKENNAVLIDALVTNATVRILTPSKCVSLSFLVSGGNGGGKVAYHLRHEDGTGQTGTFVCFDWNNGPNAAYTAGGRVNISTFAFDRDPGNPRLYANDIALTNTGSPVTSIDFDYVSGYGHEVIFAISGCTGASQPFTPLLFTGYNQDIVVEASSTLPGFLSGFTTATMDDGAANSGNTVYEQGYYPPAPLTGLPPAGATITAANAPDHHFTLASSYTSNNAVLVDAINATASLKPVAPPRCARLSFLLAAARGPVTNRCVIQHLDGTAETNRFVAPDWFDTAACAFAINGSVKLTRRFVDTRQANGPSLFAADVNLANTASPITNLVVSYAGGGLDAHATIFAVSGSDAGSPPVQPGRLTVERATDGAWVIHSTSPGRLQSTTKLEGARTVWKEEGQISTTARLNPALADAPKFYRVVSP